ncbi:glycosyltransferase family 2 protein [Halomicroarcula limicola]|uniref:Glycosyltransferase family 2 protein n=1 Tax=Haloarcula limicola TaxID=1429915 RepID=A0A8J7Y8C2_9EURY|nr:glycosyltransferase family 2 protein [Halomicroarcula limicola]MBV0923119.1 glycosyltransferase family 2 protein [Halomicroarcula limicola]
MAEPSDTTNGTEASTSESPVSVVVPYSPAHTPENIFDDAVATAQSQSVPTELIVVEDTEQRGPSWARNRGLERASTRYVAFLDADDYWHDGKLARQLAEMDESETGICVEADDVQPSQFLRELYLGNIASLTSSVLVDTERTDIRFEEALERREDHLFVLESAAQSGICFVPDLFTVGGHDESLSQGTATRYRLEQDFRFSRYVKERVPEVRDALRFYEQPRCDHAFDNTPGDLYRLALLWPSLRAVVGMWISLLCQRLS